MARKAPSSTRPRIAALSTLTPAQQRLILALAAMAQEVADRAKAERAA